MDSLMIIFNLFLCLSGGLMIICRGRHMHPSRTRPLILWSYSAGMLAFSASALSWTFTGITETQIVAGILADVYLLMSARDWKDDQPDYANRETTPTT